MIYQKNGNRLVIRFSPFSSNPSGSQKVQGGSLHSSAGCSTLARAAMVCGASAADTGSLVATATASRPPVTGSQQIWHPNPTACAYEFGLYRARLSTITRNCTLNIEQCQSSFPRPNYTLRWKVFSHCYKGINVDPVACLVQLALGFLQPQMDLGKAASTIKVYASAISAFHRVTGGRPLGHHP